MDISIILQSLQVGEIVGDLIKKKLHVMHIDEISKGFDLLDKAENLEDIKIAYRYFREATPNDIKFVQACSLYGRAVCLPLMQEYENAALCVKQLRQMEYTKRPLWLLGTWHYKEIEKIQAECDNLLVFIEEVRKKYEPEPELEPNPTDKHSWAKIGIWVFAALLMVALGCLLAFVFFLE